jgi:hypothetical protein
MDSFESGTGHWHVLVPINRQIPGASQASHNYVMDEGTVSSGQVIVFPTKEFLRVPFFIILPAVRVTFELLTQFSHLRVTARQKIHPLIRAVDEIAHACVSRRMFG